MKKDAAKTEGAVVVAPAAAATAGVVQAPTGPVEEVLNMGDGTGVKVVTKTGNEPVEIVDPNKTNDHMLDMGMDKLVGWLGILERGVQNNDEVYTIDYASVCTPAMYAYLQQTLHIWSEVLDLDNSVKMEDKLREVKPKTPALNYIALTKEFKELHPLPSTVNKLRIATDNYTANRSPETLTKLQQAW